MENKFKKFIYTISFIAVFFIGIVLLISLIFGNKATVFIETLNNVAIIISYFVVCINAFFFVRTKRSKVYMLLYIIAVLLISVCFFVSFI